MHLEPFVFADASDDLADEDTRVAVLEERVRDKPGLLEALARALDLPGWSGRNWDALSDCLRDLGWITEPRVALFHERLPDLPDDELATYLDVLRDAVADWRRDPERQLIVGFRTADVARLRAVLSR